MKPLQITWFPELDYAGAEAVNTLCTNLSFVGNDIKRIMLTSCQAAEGKSYLAMNVMRTMAGLGKTVVLVDADLRRSQISAQYGLSFPDAKPIGLAHYLAGMCNMDEVLYSTSIRGAYMVPVGRTVTNSLSLLSSPRLGMLMDRLKKEFDLVLVDAPPVGVIIDAAEIAKSCDGVLFSVSYNRVAKKELLSARLQIEKTGCTVLGAVLNNVAFDSYTSRKYYNKAYYSHYNTNYSQPDAKKVAAPRPAAKKR